MVDFGIPIGAGIAFGLGALGTGIAQSKIGAAGAGTIAGRCKAKHDLSGTSKHGSKGHGRGDKTGPGEAKQTMVRLVTANWGAFSDLRRLPERRNPARKGEVRLLWVRHSPTGRNRSITEAVP